MLKTIKSDENVPQPPNERQKPPNGKNRLTHTNHCRFNENGNEDYGSNGSKVFSHRTMDETAGRHAQPKKYCVENLYTNCWLHHSIAYIIADVRFLQTRIICDLEIVGFRTTVESVAIFASIRCFTTTRTLPNPCYSFSFPASRRNCPLKDTLYVIF